MAKKKTKTKPKKIKKLKTKTKPKPVKKVPAKPISGYRENLDAVADEKDISDNVKHLYAVAKDLGIGCEIRHDDELGGYVVNLSETSEDRSFVTAAEAEEFLHEQEEQ
jgi:hypothetical protein